MQVTLSFNIKSKLFVARKKHDLENAEIKHASRFDVSDSVFKAATSPYHTAISNFSNSASSLDLKCVIEHMELPESLLIALADLFAQLQGNTAVCSISAGGKHYVFRPKKFHSFSEMIKVLKHFWSQIFTEKIIEFFSKTNLSLLNINVSIQRWDQSVTILSTDKAKFFITKDGEKFCFYEMNQNQTPQSQSLLIFKDKEFARIAVVGIVCYQNKFLLLKQKDDAKLWRPPCGGAHKGEDCVLALKREIKEDSGIDVDVILPVSIWKNSHGIDNTTLSITYVCDALSDEVQISHEYTDFIWIKDLASFKGKTSFDLSSWHQYVELARFYESLTRKKPL